ncbi:MAG: hypothetical protein H8E53_05265, partial [Planctomycetes bacterium]|nr:hypothetical protein [Planctomycetota bacterium]
MRGFLAVLVLCNCSAAADSATSGRDAILKKLKDASAGLDRVVFVKRITYTANHYYSEY